MSWEDIVKRKKMKSLYKNLIDDVVQELSSPASAQEIYSLMRDKFEKEIQFSGPRVLSGRFFPDIGAVRHYLKVNHKSTGMFKQRKLYGGK
mgnify:FL=1